MLDPGVLDPGVLDPGVLDPGVLDPGVLDPGVLDPGVPTRVTPRSASGVKVSPTSGTDARSLPRLTRRVGSMPAMLRAWHPLPCQDQQDDTARPTARPTGGHVTDGRTTYVLVDGENIDATLGVSLLRRTPKPQERPRWDRVLAYLAEQWDQPVKGLFFLNARNGFEKAMPFVSALLAMDWRPVPLSGPADVKVVDVAIERTMRAIAGSPHGDVALVSHDGDFLEPMQGLVEEGRRLAVLGFPEFMNLAFAEMAGVEVLDLELDVQAFLEPLPRVRVIPIEEFDPLRYL